MPQIEISGLRYTYPEHSFQVEIDRQSFDSPLTAIVGQNGAGKSTLLKLLIGVTFQDPDDQLFNATVQKEVAWGLSQIESDQLMIKKAADQALVTVGLADKAAENPYDLSLSERKLLTFATVLAINPAIYLFDEPMMSLDWPSRKRMTNIFHQLVKSGHQVITITHDMDWVAAEFSTVHVMAHGQIAFSGTPSALFGNSGLVKRVGLLPPRIMTITSALGDHSVYLTPEDYCRKHKQVANNLN